MNSNGPKTTGNHHGQHVGACLGDSPSHPFAKSYAMTCEVCGYVYEANGCDVHNRRCPAHQGGRPSN